MSLSLSCAELEAGRSARDRPGVFDERIRPNLLAQIIFVPGVPIDGLTAWRCASRFMDPQYKLCWLGDYESERNHHA